MCFRRARNDFIPWEIFKQVIDELRGHHISLGLHFAGESLLHPDFKQFLSYAMKYHSEFNNIGFFTNGMLFSHDIADFIIEQEIDWVTFSLEGYAKQNDVIRIGSKYEIVANNIQYLVSNRKNRKPFVSINSTMQKEHDEKSWMDFVKDWTTKVDRISLNPCTDDKFKWFKFWNNVKLENARMCHSPFISLDVLCNGNVTLCGCDLNGEASIGNVKQKGLFAVWNSLALKNRQYELLTKRISSYPCNICDRWKYYVTEKPTVIEGVRIFYDKFVKNYER
jgi:sulfatase maturation enzyme AslB (radical SAM superfamily)